MDKDKSGKKNRVDKENIELDDRNQEKEVSRRKVIASIGLTGAAALLSGGLFSAFSQRTFAMKDYLEQKDPLFFDDAGRLSYRYSANQTERTIGDKLREIISVKDFGATGDGAVDDTDAFLQAEKAAGENPIYVPSGTYNAYSKDLKGRYFGRGATVIFRIPDTFYNTIPDSEKTRKLTVHLSAFAQPVLNEFYGKGSGKNAHIDAYTNTSIGEKTLEQLTTGKQNTALGFQSQQMNKTQYSNVSIGSDSLSKGEIFGRSVGIGSNAMKWSGIKDPINSRHELWLDEHDVRDPWSVPDSSSYFLYEMNPDVEELIKPDGEFPAATSADQVEGNVGVGRNALLQLVKGSYNVALGYQALSRSYTIDRSVALGAYALSNSLAGFDNIGIGTYALRFNQKGSKNTVIGYDAAYSDVFGDRNVIMGHSAARMTKGDKNPSNTLNTIIGTYASQNKTDGSNNVVIGGRALLNGESGSRNVVIGTEAGKNYTGSNSIILGNGAEPNIQQDRILWVDYGNDEHSTPFLFGDMGNDVLNVRANLSPDIDTMQSLGTPSRQWDSLYTKNGTIRASDERKKQQISDVPDTWLDAWEEVNFCRYKFNKDVEADGESARWHVGVIAQQIDEAFKRYNLDALDIGILCYDEWEEENVNVFDSEGNLTNKKEVSVESDNLWGIRTEECLFLEMALMRRELKRLKEKVL